MGVKGTVCHMEIRRQDEAIPLPWALLDLITDRGILTPPSSSALWIDPQWDSHSPQLQAHPHEL